MTSYTQKQLESAIKKHGSGRKAAPKLGLPRTTMQDMLNRFRNNEFGANKNIRTSAVSKPRKGKIKRYILSAAQANTMPHMGFLKNLKAYADHMDAEIMIASYAYHHSGGRASARIHEDVAPHIVTEQMEFAGKAVFCPELSISATANNPLMGLEAYTKEKHGIFPHAKLALRAVATPYNRPPKHIMTTGAVTLPNYSAKRAGVKAEFHHIIGALILEIDGDGDVFIRQLVADQNGTFQDLNLLVKDGRVSRATVAAITYGDIHTEQIDPVVEKVTWGKGGLVDVLAPEHQFFHDALDFLARNHHNIHDPHFRYKMHIEGTENVDAAIKNVADFLQRSYRGYATSYVVESNHDLMLLRWLKEADYKNDPVNAPFFLEAQKACYDAVTRGDMFFSVFEWAILRHLSKKTPVRFLRETDSVMVLGVEHAMHGHRGANGARGHVSQFAKAGPRAFVAHAHSIAIQEGVWQVGTTSKLDLGYNRAGLSSWSHTHGITYLNGKRALVTVQNGKWRA